MIYGERNKPVEEHFTVVGTNGNMISGIDTSGFIAYIYDPNGNEVSSSTNGFFTELGNGNYKYTFIPNLNGIWYVNVIHPIYFPWGKSDDIKVDEGSQTEIYEMVIRTLGLAHENIFIDNTIYDDNSNMISARVRLYSKAEDIGTNKNVIATYLITSDGLSDGKFASWSQIKI